MTPAKGVIPIEVASPEYELIATRRNNYGTFQLVFDTETRSYYLTHRKSGVKLGFEFAGTDEARAIALLDGYIAERSTGAY